MPGSGREEKIFWFVIVKEEILSSRKWKTITITSLKRIRELHLAKSSKEYLKVFRVQGRIWVKKT